MSNIPSIYGVVCGKDNVHIDVSTSLHATKIYATKLGLDTISVRHNGGYIVKEICWKRSGKWSVIDQGQVRYNTKNNSR